MKKILVAVHDDFTRRLYFQLFRKEKFKVLETKNGKEVLDLASKERPDIILADVFLSETGGLELLEVLKKEVTTKRIPVVIFTQIERKGDKIKAIELEAKDFIIGNLVPPQEVVLRIRVALGEQKTYRLVTCKENLTKVEELAKDLGYSYIPKCPYCGSPFSLFLMRDFSKGRNYFKISFICPKCG